MHPELPSGKEESAAPALLENGTCPGPEIVFGNGDLFPNLPQPLEKALQRPQMYHNRQRLAAAGARRSPG